MKKVYSIEKQGFTQLGNTFNVIDFCDDNTGKICVIDVKLLSILNEISRHFNDEIVILSGYRTVMYNKLNGSSATSLHCKGQACDFKLRETPVQEVVKYCQSIGVKGLGLYVFRGDYIHIDTRDSKKYWVYFSSDGVRHEVDSFK